MNPDDMKLIKFPDPILLRKCEEIDPKDISQEHIDKMVDICSRYAGVAISAPQVGWPVRLFVINPGYQERQIDNLVFINPSIISKSGSSIHSEGCLSLPMIFGDVRRAREITVRAFNVDGQEFVEKASNLDARIVQHEYDHLNGMLFTSKVVPSQKKLINKKLKLIKKDVK